MKVYIYKPHKEFQDDWLYAAYLGFTELGAEIKFFEDVNKIPYAPDNIVIGYIEDTRNYFEKNKIEFPLPLNIPVDLDLSSHLGRKVKHCFPAYKVMDMEGPLFVKPAMVLKGCASGVIKEPKKLEELGISKSNNLFVSDVVEFMSEYRCFIYDGNLVGIKHYSGDFRVFPNINRIMFMIADYTDSPIAYTLDVGVVESVSGESTYLVECNDFWSVANYGLDPIIYAKMLRDRWFELTGFRVQQKNI